MNLAENITIRAEQRGSQNSEQSSLEVLNYQNALRVIGRYLDQQQTTTYGITESENGFILNPLKRSSMVSSETVFSECVLQELLRGAVSQRGAHTHAPGPLSLFGTSSEDLLRAVGYKLDARRARMAAVAVLPSRVVVCGRQPSTSGKADESEPFELILDLPAVRLLLFEARSRRSTHQPVRVESAMSADERRLAYRMAPLHVDADSPNVSSN